MINTTVNKTQNKKNLLIFVMYHSFFRAKLLSERVQIFLRNLPNDQCKQHVIWICFSPLLKGFQKPVQEHTFYLSSITYLWWKRYFASFTTGRGWWGGRTPSSGASQVWLWRAAGHLWVSPDICDFYLPHSLIFLRESESQKGSLGWGQGLDMMCTNRSHHHHLGYSQCPHRLPANSYGFVQF